MAKHYDFLILGGGAAAFAAATVSSGLGLKTVMINDGLPLGGTCVNVGCVPSKYLLELGFDHIHSGRKRFDAITPGQSALDFGKAIAGKDDVVSWLRQRNYQNVIEGFENVDFLKGFGSFVSPTEVRVDNETITADKILIATGSTTYVPAIEGLDTVEYLTNEEALTLKALPEKLLVIGAGPLGLEFAQMFAHFGSEVTLFANHDRVLPHHEPEVGQAMGNYLADEGIRIYTHVSTEKIEQKGNQKAVTACVNGEQKTLLFDHVLIATGIKPNSDLNLEAAGVRTNQKGFIQTNEYLKTEADNIWAAGDVVGKMALETVAAKEGSVAARNAFKGETPTINYDHIPHAVFTYPSVASVGLTEEEEMDRFNACACRTVPMDIVPKALAVNDTRGLVKMVVHPQTGVILGVHIVAPYAAEMIHEAVVAVKAGMTLDDLIDTVHVFPTYSEGIKMAAQAFRRDVSKMSCCVE